jgi:hypothetical protein
VTVSEIDRTYRHHKGKYYQVVALATHTETGEELVIYRALYGERRIWARPISMFTDEVIVNGENRPRFARVEQASS